jgi:hypothetical protein
VPKSGDYFITSYSWIDTYGYLYADSFNPLNREENLITGNDDDASSSQFSLPINLQSMKRYILVVTTNGQNVTGPVLVIAFGPERVTLTSMDSTSTTPPGLTSQWPSTETTITCE